MWVIFLIILLLVLYGLKYMAGIELVSEGLVDNIVGSIKMIFWMIAAIGLGIWEWVTSDNRFWVYVYMASLITILGVEFIGIIYIKKDTPSTASTVLQILLWLSIAAMFVSGWKIHSKNYDKKS